MTAAAVTATLTVYTSATLQLLEDAAARAVAAEDWGHCGTLAEQRSFLSAVTEETIRSDLHGLTSDAAMLAYAHSYMDTASAGVPGYDDAPFRLQLQKRAAACAISDTAMDDALAAHKRQRIA